MRQPRRLDFVVDKLTNSIENLFTGEMFETEIVRLGNDSSELLSGGNWQFNWITELLGAGREVYKLTTRANPSIIQGLISMEERHDHVFVHLLESADYNIGHKKIYAGVAGNLVAFACKKSFEMGYQGFVSFDAKTRLMAHYEKTLGAKRFSYNGMFIGTREAYVLVKKYFPAFER